MHNLVTCNGCGWVHYEVDEYQARRSIEEFNKHYDAMSEEYKSNYVGRASIMDYMYCMRCHTPYLNFKDSEDGDVPDGSTVNLIMSRAAVFHILKPIKLYPGVLVNSFGELISDKLPDISSKRLPRWMSIYLIAYQLGLMSLFSLGLYLLIKYLLN